MLTDGKCSFVKYFIGFLYILRSPCFCWKPGHVGHRVTSHSVKVARKLVASNRYAATHIDWSDVNRSEGVRPFFRVSSVGSNRTGVWTAVGGAKLIQPERNRFIVMPCRSPSDVSKQFFSGFFKRFRKNCGKRLLAPSRLSVLPSVLLPTWNNSAPTGRIFMKFDIGEFFVNVFRKSNFQWNLRTIKGTLHEDHYTFLTISRSAILRMRNVWDKL